MTVAPLRPRADRPDPLVQLRAVSAGYDGTTVLHDVDLEVVPGQYTGVVGPSGSGKTTLVRLLTDTGRPSGGSVDRVRDLRVFVRQERGAVERGSTPFTFTIREIGGRENAAVEARFSAPER